MKKKVLHIITVCILLSTAAFAQTGLIRGTVKTVDGQPAESVTIALKGTGKGANTAQNGAFQIRNVEPGNYTVVASFVGLTTKSQAISIKANQIVTINFVLEENSAKLSEVVISANKSRNKLTSSVAKMPLKNLENPQVYNSVSSEIIKQQAITSFDDVIRNVPGLSQTWQSTGRAGDGASYFALRGFEAQTTLVNGLPGLTGGNFDLADVEEVQVMKGPSATLFGASFVGYGGIINTITKKPYYNFGGEVAYNVGSFGLNRVTVDVNSPLSKTEKMALRVNAAYHTENSFQNAGFKKSFFVAPAFTWEVNNRLKIDVLAEIMNERRAVAPVFFQSDRATPLIAANVKDLGLNYNESFMNNDLPIKNPRNNIQAQVNYKLSDEWNSQTVLAYSTAKSDGYYSYIYDDGIRDNFFAQYFHIENNLTKTFNIQQNFNGDFKLFGLRNRLLVGLDFLSRTVTDKGSGWATARYVTPQNANVAFDYTDADNDIHFPATPNSQLTRGFINNLLPADGYGNSSSVNRTYGAYASNVLNITNKLSAMLSLRVDRFEAPNETEADPNGFGQTAFSHKLGLVYQPVLDKVSIFGNYMNSFNNVNPSLIYDADGQSTNQYKAFKPEHANQWEVGVKTNLFDDKLSATISYYDIKVTDRVYTDPNNQNNSIQGGRVKSKGFEIAINANPTQGLNLIAGYSHNSTKVLAGATTDFYNEPGRTPGGQGPANQANFWATYKFPAGALKNFGIGAGANYAGEYKVIDNSVTGVFALPSYTLVNGTVFFNSNHYRVNFNLNNILDKQYYIGYWSINPQKQRNFVATVAYKF
ncbi:TonB-dependent receptor [Mucilaginibacter conchicola]|uniref:TonB-dependent receptor n=1 Tax=Mucilaginibacter conchicola TaxID=2303333 RepID=A0A372NTN9_9SPHI|nr:TonB-dependent receptor [Mucilaginibacter conchicola]RFZ92643.1 TonB-dependent receptor [Mucilaginibacter conchicola]